MLPTKHTHFLIFRHIKTSPLHPQPVKSSILKSRDLITQSEHELHCFRKSSRLYATRPPEEDKVLQYIGLDLPTSGSQGFLDALGLGTLWLQF